MGRKEPADLPGDLHIPPATQTQPALAIFQFKAPGTKSHPGWGHLHPPNTPLTLYPAPSNQHQTSLSPMSQSRHLQDTPIAVGRGDRASLPQRLNSRGRRAAGSRSLTSCGTNPAGCGGPGHQQAGKAALPFAKSLPWRRTVGYGTRPEVGFKEITTSPPG